MKGGTALELKIHVQPESWLPKRWLHGRGILEQSCHSGRTAGLSHLTSGGST